MPKHKVAILMGSDSDWDTMESCMDQLKKLDIECEVQVNSAHRTPERVHEFAASARENGYSVIIAAAGMSAALAGTVAAKTTLPVIGVPVESGPLRGMDALLSTVQNAPRRPCCWRRHRLRWCEKRGHSRRPDHRRCRPGHGCPPSRSKAVHGRRCPRQTRKTAKEDQIVTREIEGRI